MNDPQLDRLLRSVRPPARTAGYWESFPETVQRRLRRGRGAAESSAKSGWPPWALLPWLATVGAAIALGLLLLWPRSKPVETAEFTPSELQTYREIWRQISTLFPHQVRAVILGPDGPRVLLADQPNLPVSPPVVLRRCAANGCDTALTFSGQSLRFAGRELEVLTDSRGGVIVAAEDAIWPGSSASLNLKARLLETTL